MRFLALRPWESMLLVVTLAACSSASTPAGGTAEGTPPGSESGGDPSAPAPGEADPASSEAAGDTFDLVLRGVGYKAYFDLMGETSYEVMAAVESDATKKRVAWSTKMLTPANDTFELTWPKLLAKGTSYRVGVAAYGGYALHTIPAVTGKVVLELDQEKSRAAASATSDAAYEVLNTKVTLAPGTYQATLPAAGTSITMIVGPSGTLASRSITLGCTGAAACGKTSIWSNPTCGPSFVRGDDLTSNIDVDRNQERLAAKVSIEGASFRVKGTMKSGTCCSVPVDVLVPRTSAATDSCK